ncbi:MAG: TetR/AcrR family transcriptional regulator [Clostridia bacterium]|nr:TetR/AcrR family transcriptional regulator [Clostridia bacterium]
MANEKNELIKDGMSDKIVETAEKIVTANGAHTLTVRMILQTLGITNRVFYNRFHNIDEVLNAIYRNTILKVRESIASVVSGEKDFFERVLDIVTKTLIISYDTRMQFTPYVFENDSISQSNFEWWKAEIKKLIDYAKEQKYIKDVDSDSLSYSIWCFCRGFNADAVGRKLPKDEAVKNFKYGFGFLLEGLKATPQ